jgi:hypothetical protein
MKTSEEKIKNLAFQYLEKIQGNLLVLKPKEKRLIIYSFIAGFYECEDIVNSTLDRIENNN